MDLGRAISFPFDDRDWPVKTLVGTLLCLIPFVALGYQVSVARNVIHNRKNPLPGTDEIGQVVTDAIMATIGGMIFFLPLTLVMCVFLFPTVLTGNSDVSFILSCLVLPCLVIFGILYAIPATGMYWAGLIRYAQTGNFSEFLQISSLWGDVRMYFSTLVLLLAYYVAVTLVAVIVAPFLLVTCVGIFVLGFGYMVITGHLIGQAGQLIMREEG
ncbi:MAG TPA: DUF4013 domain-containing protein [Aggregatilineaceae bacterium]|nr:DUF4013 domain-containing protein [Aggregatilineaceae bacterium]